MLSLKWNYNGSLLAAACKDKRLHIIDPRAGKIVCQNKIHDGSKASKVEWVGSSSCTDDCNKLITTGFSSQAERQIGIWDLRQFAGAEADPLNMLILDQGTGALYPFFDVDSQMLYVAGKGDANCRYFELTDSDPYLHFIADFRTTVPQKGFAFFPKRSVDVGCHEVMRGLKLEANAAAQISFRVPRKSEVFQEDLFPDTAAGIPAMEAEEWVGGAEARPPLLKSLSPSAGGDAVQKKSSTASSTRMVSVKELKEKLAEAETRIAFLEKENEVLKQELAKFK